MEPNKLDTRIKEKIEVRTIQPSNEAWDRLDAMLTLEEKPKRSYSWLYIAASFVGLLMIGSIYFNSFNTEIIDQAYPVVQEQKSTLEEPEILDKEVFSRAIQNKISKTNIVVASGNSLKQEAKKHVASTEGAIGINQPKENEATVNSSNEKGSQAVGSTKYMSAEKLLAEVGNTKFESNATDKTIDKIRNRTVVDPNILLSSAENELNQTYRETALGKISKTFNAIKVVVANRNYEE